MKIRYIDYQKKGQILHALIYTDSKPAPFWRSTDCTTKKAARQKEPEIREKFLAEHPSDPPDAGNTEPGAGQMSPPGPEANGTREAPPNSVLALLVAIMLLIGKYWEDNTRTNYQRAQRVIEEGLGDRGLLAPEQLDEVDWVKVRENLDTKIPDGSRRQVGGMVRRLTKELILRGLPHGCLHHLSNVKGKSQNEASGEPFLPPHIQKILASLPLAPDTVQGLVWFGLSAGPQIIDVGTMRYDEIKLKNGMVKRHRTKIDDAPAEFALLPEALEWVQRRHRPGNVYVFPELYFGFREQQQPDCNTKPVAMSNNRKSQITQKGSKLFGQFLTDIGIKSDNLTFKSFRQHVVSMLSSQGIKEKLRMRMLGHQVSTAHIRYDFPAYWEFFKVRDILSRNLKAIQEGKEVRYILSFSEVVDELEALMRKEFAEAEARASRRHRENILCHTENHKGILELQTKADLALDGIHRMSTILQLELYRDKEANEDNTEDLEPLFEACRARTVPPAEHHDGPPVAFVPAASDIPSQN